MADTSIDTLTLDIVVNNDKAVRRINNVTKALEKLNNAISKSGNIDNVLGSATTSGGGTIGTSSSKTKEKSGRKVNVKNFNIFNTLGKLNYYRNTLKYYARLMAEMVQYAIDYNETVNLWQVANRENVALASEFVDKMSSAYGVSEQALMNYQAIFKNMLSSLGGLSDQISTKLSQNLTQMALDFASLYNVSIESAMTKFQGVLSGQVRPIRSVSGYDITETTIYDIYQKAGGDKTMRQLSQLEKRLLRIYAVFQQMQETGATGDLEKTIESAANQARIMSEQLKESLTWIGQMVLLWLNKINLLQKVNALLMTAKELAKSLAFSLGYEPENWSIASVFEEANEEVDKLESKLLSFDKFNVLSTSQETTMGIDPKIEEIISKINSKMSETQMKAKLISESWLEQLGVGQKMYKILDENGNIITKTAEEYKKLTDEQKASFKAVETYRDISKLLEKIYNWAEETGLVSFAKSLYKFVKEVFPYAKDFAHELIPVLEQILKIVTPIITAILNVLTPVLKIIFNILKGLMPIINVILKAVEIISLLVSSIFEFLSGILGMDWSDWKEFFLFIKVIFENIKEIVGWIVNASKKVGGFLGKAFSWIGKNVSISGFASGGYPEMGQLFIANEQGAELVGNIGGRTAVANNDMIVKAIEEASYRGIVAGLSASGSHNTINFSFRDVNANDMARGLAQSMAKELQRQGYKISKI